MKLSIQNSTVMVTLPQAKAKARALAKYAEYFNEESLSGPDKKYIDALKTGGTITVELLVGFHTGLNGHLKHQLTHLNESYDQIKSSERLVKRAFELDRFTGVMGNDLLDYQKAVHNREADMVLAAADYFEWIDKSQKLPAVGACGILAHDLLNEPDKLPRAIMNMEDDGVLPKGCCKKFSQMSPFSQYAYALQLIAEFGQPQLVDELLRVEEVAA